MLFSQMLNEKIIDEVGGIDKFEPGLICVLDIFPMMDDDRITSDKGDFENQFKKLQKKAAGIPALIISANKLEDDWPVYDVWIWTRSNTGEASGAILLKDLCVWRYISDKDVPEWFKNGFDDDWFKNAECDLTFNQIHYYKGSKKIYLKDN